MDNLKVGDKVKFIKDDINNPKWETNYGVKIGMEGIVEKVCDCTIGIKYPNISTRVYGYPYQFQKLNQIPKYDESTTKAIIDSTKHHENNLHKLKTVGGDFRNNNYHHEFFSGMVSISYRSGKCALCKKFTDGSGLCKKCPLTITGQHCNKDNSAWKKIKEAGSRQEAITAEENMVRVLRSLLLSEIVKTHYDVLCCQAKKEVKGDKICPCLDYAGMMNFTQKGKPISDCCSCNGTGIVKEEETNKKINIENYKCPKCNKNMIVYDVESLSPTLVNKVGYIISQEIKVIINSTYKCNCGMTIIDKELITYYPNKTEE